jgi:hypothetical protein
MMRSAFAIKFLLLAVFAVVWSNAAAATAESTAACALTPEIVFQSEYCCTLRAKPFNLSKSDNAEKKPCTCRSQANARFKEVVFTDAFRWHLSIKSLILHQYPLRFKTQSAIPANVHSFENKPRSYILNACLLI